MMTHATPLKMQVFRDASALQQTIAIVHAMPLMRFGLAEVLRASQSFSTSNVVAFANLSQAEADLAAAIPGDVIILDTHAWSLLGGPGGAGQLQALKARGVTVGLIASAGGDTAKLLSGRGISGLLSPDAELAAVVLLAEDLSAGRQHFPQGNQTQGTPSRLSRLSSRQFEILELMTRGLLNKQIAWELGLTEGTVKSHVSAILDKLGCDRRTQAIAAFMQCFGVGRERVAFA
jgi:DNA-binding NarL/FixJ family response regulator